MKFLTILLVALTFITCKRQECNCQADPVVGHWLLVENLADPGDGSGVFVPVASQKYLQFTTSGQVLSNGTICDMSISSSSPTKATYTNSTATIQSVDCPNTGGPSLNYTLNADTLILNYPCFEPCRAKYIRQ